MCYFKLKDDKRGDKKHVVKLLTRVKGDVMTSELLTVIEIAIREKFGDSLKSCCFCECNDFLTFTCDSSVSKTISEDELKKMIVIAAKSVGIELDSRMRNDFASYLYFVGLWAMFTIEQPNGIDGDSIVKLSLNIPELMMKSA